MEVGESGAILILPSNFRTEESESYSQSGESAGQTDVNKGPLARQWNERERTAGVVRRDDFFN